MITPDPRAPSLVDRDAPLEIRWPAPTPARRRSTTPRSSPTAGRCRARQARRPHPRPRRPHRRAPRSARDEPRRLRSRHPRDRPRPPRQGLAHRKPRSRRAPRHHWCDAELDAFAGADDDLDRSGEELLWIDYFLAQRRGARLGSTTFHRRGGGGVRLARSLAAAGSRAPRSVRKLAGRRRRDAAVSSFVGAPLAGAAGREQCRGATSIIQCLGGGAAGRPDRPGGLFVVSGETRARPTSPRRGGACVKWSAVTREGRARRYPRAGRHRRPVADFASTHPAAATRGVAVLDLLSSAPAARPRPASTPSRRPGSSLGRRGSSSIILSTFSSTGTFTQLTLQCRRRTGPPPGRRGNRRVFVRSGGVGSALHQRHVLVADCRQFVAADLRPGRAAAIVAQQRMRLARLAFQGYALSGIFFASASGRRVGDRRHLHDRGADRPRRHGRGLPRQPPPPCPGKKKVAIKILHAEVADDESLARFRREAEIASRLGHPNIVEVHDFNVAARRHALPRLEYLHGETLARAPARGPMPLERRWRSCARSARRSPPRTARASSTAISSRRTSSSCPPRSTAGRRDREGARLRHLEDPRLADGQDAGHRAARHAAVHGARAGDGPARDRSTSAPTSSRSARSSTRCCPASRRSGAATSPRSCSRSCTSSRRRSASASSRLPPNVAAAVTKALEEEGGGPVPGRAELRRGADRAG